VAPVFLGGRGALLALGHGRIVAGQRLETAARPAPRAVPPGALDGATGASTGTIALAFGPDPVSAALREAILSASFHVSPTSDRAGTRLAGPDLPVGADASATSRPMVRGGVQLTRAGLIVLGPDHPTTGGYPLVAVVPRQDQAALFALRVGARLRFVEAAASTS
jgi:allophanate hydrolase subunit 2